MTGVQTCALPICSTSTYSPEPTVAADAAPVEEPIRYTYMAPVIETVETPSELIAEMPVLPLYEEQSPAVEATPVLEEPEISLDGLVEDLGSDSAFKLAEPPEEEFKEEETASPVLFSERQRQFLRGRLVTRIITDSRGTVLANAGDTITDEMINRIRHAGRLVELVMNNEP